MPELNPVPEDYEDQFTGANVITPAQFIINEQRRATANTITSLDADPEQASRAQKLADATGAPPAIVFGNLENYEQQHKAAITSQLLSNNKFLMDYAESHPLAAKISNDDWGQLATVSDQAKYFAPRDVRAMGPEEIHAAGSVLAEAAKGFSEGVDYDSLSREHQRAVDWFAKQPVFANLFIRQAAIAGVTGLELANRLAGGVITGGAKAVAEMYRQSGIESVLPPEMSS